MKIYVMYTKKSFTEEEIKALENVGEVIFCEESSNHKWISFDELASNPHYSNCIDKIKDIM